MQDTQTLHPDTEAQIAALSLDSVRPVIICDADEVLFQFLACFEMFLRESGLRLELRYPASLHKSIFPLTKNTPVDDVTCGKLLKNFYERDVENMHPIPGAREALASLSGRAQILILTNIPFAYCERRKSALRNHGMDYPLIANRGLKGVALARLLDNQKAPAFFVEDMSVHLFSAATIPGLHCIQFIHHEGLKETAKRAEGIYQADKGWDELRLHIESQLNADDAVHTGRTSATSGM